MRLLAADIHRELAGGWREALIDFGVDPACLTGKHAPCPVCGGKDRFRFDDKDRRGTWFCQQACNDGKKAGDGLTLVRLVNGWTFPEALNKFAAYLGFNGRIEPTVKRHAESKPPPPPVPAVATQRVQDLLDTSSRPDLVANVVSYLTSRNVWPLPPDCGLLAHVGVEYRRQAEGKSWVREGIFACLVAPVVDLWGETVTVHLTYLDGGKKLARADHEGVQMPARKILSPMTGRIGCSVRLMPRGETLGIAEGIETALSAWLQTGVPTWSALSAGMMAKFMPPPDVRKVVIFADRDIAGLEAAWALRDQLAGRCSVELCLPPGKFADWNDFGRTV